jgi:hypothetical protein
LELGKKDYLKKIRLIHNSLVAIASLKTLPTLRTAVLRAGSRARIGIGKKGFLKKIR